MHLVGVVIVSIAKKENKMSKIDPPGHFLYRKVNRGHFYIAK